MLELYHSGLTTCSKQVRLCLREKGIDYVSRYIELWNYENLSQEYKKLNPNGVVPTLVHDGVSIINSNVINEYIDDLYPEPPLRPADLIDRSRMRFWTWTADDIHMVATNLTYMGILKSRMEGLSEEDKAIMVASTPAPDRRERWRRMATGGYSQEELQAALDKVEFGLSQMEKDLAAHEWLACDSYSLADISMLAIYHRVAELYPEITGKGAFNRAAAWRQQMMERPAVEWVYRPGTEEAPKRPDVKSISGIV